MSKKRKVVIIIAIVTACIVAIGLIIRYRPISKEEMLTTEQLLQRTTDIQRKYGKHESRSEIAQGGQREYVINRSNTNKIKLSEMSADEDILELYYVGKGWNEDYKQSWEINAMFECFLFMKDRNMEDDIKVIDCVCRSRGDYVDAGETARITITIEEFEQLYAKLPDTDKRDEELAAELVDLWLEVVPYNRYGLEFPKEYAYRELLLTEWKDQLVSTDNNFTLLCRYDLNRFSVLTTTQYNETGSVAGTDFTGIVIAEIGYFNGAWDADNNIWLWGETSGLHFFEYNGEENWNDKDPGEREMPEPLIKVKELMERTQT
ncbi:hypothetical protein LJC56_11885, partial [Christensenellaceae bacterium OttesenSCG-928-K19]|nr:hypothetical protein [Christensenellaceae bacterium OttesenSCG-928-K19]